MAESKHRATYEDLLKLPDHVVGELIDGELIVSPRPALAYANTASTLGGDLSGPFHKGRGGPGGWWILDEPEIHLHPEVLVPDLAGWRRERLPTLPKTAAMELAPDWVCEVVSPSTAQVDRRRKMAIYARVQVPHVWLVDPLAKTLEVYRLEAEGWKLAATHTADERVHVEPFSAIELELGTWWLPD